ncbi:phosphatidate cytidylyltransferase [uncultured Parolsenella sp.]|uniref:phosphatidate cytidylyltransferase n=1 Tax=uncultured Parolsenella sp. TaxID=2083008 RepID=UPI0027D9A9E4|nr:phosphatidate cytidylyltransferase [uncultured Parolsenella sp.]
MPESNEPELTGEGSARQPRNLDNATASLERRHEAREGDRVVGGLRSQRARSWTERFLTRSTYGVLYALVVLACLFWGRIPTMVLVAAMSWLCCSEFYRIVRLSGRMPNEVIGLAAAVVYPTCALFRPEAETAVTLLLMLVCGSWYVVTPRSNLSDAAVTVFGAVYTGLLYSSIVTIRAAAPGLEGALLALGAMGSVWVNDATAYIVGSKLGRRKLAPRISPNKSWEGMIGGLVGSCAVWALVWWLGVLGVSLPLALLAGILCGVTGVIGDLFESRLKRSVGVKDSGNLIPGHGGLLDRSDSMLFASMTAYFVLHLGGIL